ncbi:hypothetical protein CEE37_06895 [candidate division LCP-89 bacterium B3_LCP]|uniref:Uncharacterized protein n=1 Tax=candidate division LCP-89 bacterium B3_LCP TaxID=2012998 RepID=A0A532V0E0_UNCL8|nr:MAG: hypothetical protein CEE37_06895 [candidate division LCP-89 bacterium B3_LCP]
MNRLVKLAIILICMMSVSIGYTKPERLKPYILVSSEVGTIDGMKEKIRNRLIDGEFEIVGEYQPYDSALILIVTDEQLKQAAALSEMGGFGAALRVSLTQVEDKVQLAYNNPFYVAQVYRMTTDLDEIAKKMETVLGSGEPFGSKKGVKVKRLRRYHYGGRLMPMPSFDDWITLMEYETYDEAIQAIEKGLAEGRGGTSKIYRVDIPGKEETLIGVAIKEGKGSDLNVMGTTDTEELKQTPHLPYEVLISGGTIYTLHGKFRIAQSFPSLGMGTFMKISGAPKAIASALRQAAGGVE